MPVEPTQGGELRQYVLLNPGPGNTTESVRRALLTPDLCHREAEFFEAMREVRHGLLEVAGVSEDTHAAVLLTASGTAAVEAAVCSAVPPGRALLVLVNGTYGDRIRQMAVAHGIPHAALTWGWTEPADPGAVARALDGDPGLSHVALIHHETTTGLLNPLHEIGEVVRRAGRALIVDAMSSFGGEAIDVERDHIDLLAASANKCLQGMPGISFVIGRRAAFEALRGHPARSVYLDLGRQYAYQERDDTPFTPAIQVLFALRQAIREALEETVAGRIRRYREAAEALRAGMEALGLRILVPPGRRSGSVTTFALPDGVDYTTLHDAMKRRGYVIYAGHGDLSKQAFRVANIGTLTAEDMRRAVAAFADVLAGLGVRTGPAAPTR
jgi:2-aminoethylphosphonate-pyruvate transaminase